VGEPADASFHRPAFVDRIEGMGMPAPVLFAWLAALAEFAGGLLLAVGLLTRPTALVVAGPFMIVALVTHAAMRSSSASWRCSS
jgi:uncharacterized membrane protein YphA (DoxX/SURF4 family)